MINWFHMNHGTHPLIALGIMLPFVLIGMPILGAGLAIGFYFGREVRDCEVFRKMNFSTHKWGQFSLWENFKWAFQGWAFWKNWSKDNHLDFWPVVVTVIVAYYLIICVWPLIIVLITI